MTSKLQIKAGQVEFVYEGESELSFEEIKELFAHIETLYSSAGNKVEPAAPSANPAAGDTPASNGVTQNYHINTVAEKLGVKSGTDMALAAAAHVQLCQGKETFSRQDLNTTMRAATKHFKESMAKNLTPSINRLLKGKINQLSNDKYSIKDTVLKELGSQLA